MFWKIIRLYGLLITLLLRRPKRVVLAGPFSAVAYSRALRLAGLNRRSAIWMHSTFVGELGRIPFGMAEFERASHKTSKIIVCSTAVAHYLRDEWSVDTSRVAIVPNGVASVRRLADPSRQPPRIVIVGRADPVKNYQTLIRVLDRINDEFTCVICADSGLERPEVESSLRAIMQPHKIALSTPPTDVYSELESAQIAVHMSLSEGFGIAVLEEMSHGLPIIASDIPALRDLVTPHRNGLLVNPLSEKEIQDALEHMIRNPALRTSFGNASREMAEGYSWEETATLLKTALRICQ